jgi:hypothetical protein
MFKDPNIQWSSLKKTWDVPLVDIPSSHREFKGIAEILNRRCSKRGNQLTY